MPEKQEPTETTSESVPEERSESTQSGAREYGGPKGREPTRYGDWEKNGRCIDF